MVAAAGAPAAVRVELQDEALLQRMEDNVLPLPSMGGFRAAGLDDFRLWFEMWLKWR